MTRTTTLALMILSMLFGCTRSSQNSFPEKLDVITVDHDLKGTMGNRFINPIDAHRIVKSFPAIQTLFRKNRPDLLPALEKSGNSIDEYSNPVLVGFSVNPAIFKADRRDR